MPESSSHFCLEPIPVVAHPERVGIAASAEHPGVARSFACFDKVAPGLVLHRLAHHSDLLLADRDGRLAVGEIAHQVVPIGLEAHTFDEEARWSAAKIFVNLLCVVSCAGVGGRIRQQIAVETDRAFLLYELDNIFNLGRAPTGVGVKQTEIMPNLVRENHASAGAETVRLVRNGNEINVVVWQ